MHTQLSKHEQAFSINQRGNLFLITVQFLIPKGRGFEPGQGDGFLRAIKICSTPSFGWKVKVEVQCHKILWHIKDLMKSHGDG
jgi:hypothetical protein